MSVRTARPDDARLARAALTRLIEPGDVLGAQAVSAWGPERALALLAGRDAARPAELDLLADLSGHPDGVRRRWSAGLQRWRPRAAHLDPVRDLVTLHRLGGGLLIPEDDAWPADLGDLGTAAPLGLWFRGAGVLPPTERALAVVGSREATGYGRAVTRQLVERAVRADVCIVSGGAYGIDGAAHRSALEAALATGRLHADPGPGTGRTVPTVAVLAGGLDRFYPAGHEDLLRQVMDAGLLVSEMPPGASPTRHRFLHRNRLIAALSAAVVVVEARWRSGAQSTAGHALALGREVGVVPGPITSPSSAGCHRLLKETPARLLADEDDALALLPTTAGRGGAGSPTSGRVARAGAGGNASRAAESEDAARRARDALTVEELLVHEALPVRTAVPVDRLTVSAGLALPTVLAVLTRLERAGLAERVEDRWRLARGGGGTVEG